MKNDIYGEAPRVSLKEQLEDMERRIWWRKLSEKVAIANLLQVPSKEALFEKFREKIHGRQ